MSPPARRSGLDELAALVESARSALLGGTAPPPRSPLSPAKAVVLRAMRVYTRGQEAFNRAILDAVDRIAREVIKAAGDPETLRAAMEPVVQPVSARVDALGTRVDALHAELEALRAGMEGVRAGLEAGRREADERYQHAGARLEQVLKFVDSVRKELFYELRYKLEEIEREAEPQILEPERYRIKAAQMPDGLRVNLGSGVIAHRGTHLDINVDLRAVDGVDVRADVRKLPFEPGSIAELSSFHLVEHFPDWELRNRVLPYWRGLLKPGGLIRIVCPDAEGMIRDYTAGKLSFDVLREVTFGGQEYDGNQHYTMLTPDSLSAILVEAGFTSVERVATGRVSGQCLEMELTARRPAT